MPEQRTIRSWIRRVEHGWGERAAITLREGLDRSATGGDRAVDIRALGGYLAATGTGLDAALAWVSMLLRDHPHVAKQMLGKEPVVALTAGWADAAIDQPTGTANTVPLEVLRMRIAQHYQASHALRIHPEAHAALLAARCGAACRDAEATAMDAVVGHVRAEYSGGQPISVSTSGVMLALVERSDELCMRLARIDRAIAADPALGGALVTVTVSLWIEPLPGSETHVAAHLDTLIS